MTSSGEDDRVGLVDRALAGVEVKGQHAKTDVIMDQQVRHILLLMHGNTQLSHLVSQRVQHRPPNIVTGIAGATIGVRSEKMLIQFTGRCPGKWALPRSKLEDRRRCLTGQNLRGSRMREEIPFYQGVGKVLFPAILRINRAQRGIDPTGGKDRACYSRSARGGNGRTSGFSTGTSFMLRGRR